MFKYSIITCIAILMLASSFMFGCGNETKKIEQKQKVVSKKIVKDQKQKSDSVTGNEKKSPAIKETEDASIKSKNDKLAPDNSKERQDEVVSDQRPTENGDDGMPAELDTENTEEAVGASEDLNIAETESQNEQNLDEEKRKAAELLANMHQEANQDSSDRENSLDGLINPFLPLFSDAPVPPKPEVKTDRPKPPPTPLTQVDLSQFKLVATLRASSGNKALVEDSTGKGYVIDKGTLIGINFGRVVEITNDSVIVDEEIRTLTGDFDIKRREIKLQKAPGE